MGELILCSQRLAALPYYIDTASLNIYSLEELSYYIENNLYLLEEDFMSEELCSWIEQEMRLKDVAEQLRDICRKNGTLAEFVTCILRQSGYCSPDSIRGITAALSERENKSEYECIKLKADRYVENKRYISGIYEYRRLLGMKEEKNEVLVGNVWHNLGKAYASLFLFGEAAECLRQAYALNQNPESLRECLYACRCMHDEKRFREIAEENGIPEEEMGEIARELTKKSRMEDIGQFEQRLEELFAEGKEQEVRMILDDWKDTYRKNCRI